ncbi:hypothetical protein GE107_08710 [Cohnella sp. CFH 77786]|uniref:hypothetical protein n=1 Tax=Cohnella sp. CFH 77786 TaxID=2662265 RepID=UPI001C610388|nr:hypothetical protein [Cohnella sp. CFH 77786]MBW5446140.1 hypothetical protein [Cohnella sp. CFH 77786]
MNTVPVDVLIIGGGVQGLVLLDELKRQGYSAALTTNSCLGSGQTLHSHGLLNSGYWIIRPELRKTLKEIVLPAAEEMGLQIYGEDQWFIVAPSSLSEKLCPGWKACGYEYEEVNIGSLPSGFQEGELRYRADSIRVFQINEYNYPKRQLIRLLSKGMDEHILYGDIVSFHCAPSEQNTLPENRERTITVDTVEIRLHDTGENVILTPKFIITAAGTGTKRLIRSLQAETSCIESLTASGADAGAWKQRMEEQLGKVKINKLHMICIKAPLGILPAASVVLFEYGLLIVAHVNQDHDDVQHDDRDYVTWYVTPVDPDQTSYDDAPDQAHAEVNKELTAAGINNLLRAYPALRQAAEKSDSLVRFTVFAGYKQDIGDQMGVPLCESLEGFDNVILTLPSVSINAWINAKNAISLISTRAKANEFTPILPFGGSGAKVGVVNELSDTVEWMRWKELLQAFPGIAQQGAARSLAE